MYGLEVVLPIEGEISSLKLVVELIPPTIVKEEHFFHLARLDVTHPDASIANEANKKCIKSQFDQNFKPCVFSEGDPEARKIKPMWLVPYIVKSILV